MSRGAAQSRSDRDGISRNCGRVWRSALATTSSEVGTLGRMGQEPKEAAHDLSAYARIPTWTRTECDRYRMAEDKGPTDIIVDPANFVLLPQFFCITDPDLSLNSAMPEDFLAQLAALAERLSIGKAGLALDIADRSAVRQEDFLTGDRHWKIWDWEEQFWQELPEGYRDNRSKAVRVAGRCIVGISLGIPFAFGGAEGCSISARCFYTCLPPPAKLSVRASA